MFIFVDVPLTLFYICIRMFYFFNSINHKKIMLKKNLILNTVTSGGGLYPTML